MWQENGGQRSFPVLRPRALGAPEVPMQNLRLIAFFLFSFVSVLAAGSDKSSPLLQNNSPTQGVAAQLAELGFPSGQFGYYVGTSVAIGADVIVSGTPYGGSTPAAFVYLKSTKGWNNVQPSAILIPSDAGNCEYFGRSIAISGDTIVVGDSEDQFGPCGPGAAYVYVKPAGGWSGQIKETAKLTVVSDNASFDGLGTSVAISANTIVVGAPGEYPYSDPGAAYVFVEPAGGWISTTETAKLTASDGNLGDGLGTSVSISNQTIAAGAPQHGAGTAYVFVQPANGWVSMTQTAELTSLPGTPHDGMGTSVAIDGDTLVAGAPYGPVGANPESAAYVFTKPANGWQNMAEKANLIAPVTQAGFGLAVAIDGNRIAVGAPYFSAPLSRGGYFRGSAFPSEGAVYVFTKKVGGQNAVTVMHGSDARNLSVLGSSVAISGDVVVGGAPRLGPDRGAVFVFGLQ